MSFLDTSQTSLHQPSQYPEAHEISAAMLRGSGSSDGVPQLLSGACRGLPLEQGCEGAGASELLIPQADINKDFGPIRPFVKWVGGKRQLLDILNNAAPSPSRFPQGSRYFEPFIGGGALLFSRMPTVATISDVNAELVNCYRVIRDDVEALIRSLRTHKNTEEHFYRVRAKRPEAMTEVQRASRFVFLNKTCFNGLYRENKSGQFNAPYGRYPNPKIVDDVNLRAISAYLNFGDIEILHAGYQHVLEVAKTGDLVYFDPPYAPMSKTANFASYTKTGFTLEDQKELADGFAELDRRGVKLMLSNSNTEVIRDLYQDFRIQTVHATRAINCKAAGRGKEANEVLVTNY